MVLFYLYIQIRVSFYSKGKETAYAVFDAHGVTDKNSWFDCSRLLYTAYDDLNRLKAVSYCGIPGYLVYMCLYFMYILLEILSWWILCVKTTGKLLLRSMHMEKD